MSTQTQTDNERWPALDKLRAVCMFGIILYHSLLSFSLGSEWFVLDPDRNRAFEVTRWFISGSFLRVFFVLAGFFSRLLYARYGLAGFAKNRAQRILIPLCAGSILSSLSVSLLTGRFAFAPFHLWFIWYLVFMIVGVCALAYPSDRLLAPSVVAAADSYFRRLVASPIGPIVLAIATVPMLQMASHSTLDNYDPAQVWAPIDTFAVDPGVFVYYSAFFCFGLLLHRNAEVLLVLARHGGKMLLAAFAVRLASLAVLTGHHRLETPEPSLGLALQLLTALFTWLVVLGGLGWFVNSFSTDSPYGRYLADASYWAYLVHTTPVIVVQAAAARMSLPTPLEFFLVFAAAIVFCLTSYEYVVRYTFIGVVLNGQRQRPDGSRALAWARRPPQNRVE